MQWEGLGRDRLTSVQAVVWVARSSHRWAFLLPSPFPAPRPGAGGRPAKQGREATRTFPFLSFWPAPRLPALGPWDPRGPV